MKNLKNNTKLLILMGKSGAGKDTVLKNILKSNVGDFFHRIVVTTTRPKRDGEVNHVDYHYLSFEEYAKKLLNGDLLTSTFFKEERWGYGIDKSELVPDKINICVWNPTGISQILSEKDLDTKIVLLKCGDKERLLRQLYREKNPNVQEIIRRFDADDKDFRDFDYFYNDFPCFSVYNEGDPYDAVNQVISYLREIGWLKSNN